MLSAALASFMTLATMHGSPTPIVRLPCLLLASESVWRTEPESVVLFRSCYSARCDMNNQKDRAICCSDTAAPTGAPTQAPIAPFPCDSVGAQPIQVLSYLDNPGAWYVKTLNLANGDYNTLWTLGPAITDKLKMLNGNDISPKDIRAYSAYKPISSEGPYSYLVRFDENNVEFVSALSLCPTAEKLAGRLPKVHPVNSSTPAALTRKGIGMVALG